VRERSTFREQRVRDLLADAESTSIGHDAEVQRLKRLPPKTAYFRGGISPYVVVGIGVWHRRRLWYWRGCTPIIDYPNFGYPMSWTWNWDRQPQAAWGKPAWNPTPWNRSTWTPNGWNASAQPTNGCTTQG